MREEVALKINLPESRVQVNLSFSSFFYLFSLLLLLSLFTPLPSFLPSFFPPPERTVIVIRLHADEKIDSAGANRKEENSSALFVAYGLPYPTSHGRNDSDNLGRAIATSIGEGQRGMGVFRASASMDEI